MPTSTIGVARQHAADAANFQSGRALQWALDIPDFVYAYICDNRVRISPRIPKSGRHAIGDAIRPVWDTASRGRDSLREAACNLAIIFPAAVLWTQASGALANIMRKEVDRRLDLWRRGDIPSLIHEAELARLSTQPPVYGPSTARGYLAARISWTTHKADRLIRNNRFQDVASLAQNHGTTPLTPDNVAEIHRMFPPQPEDDPSGHPSPSPPPPPAPPFPLHVQPPLLTAVVVDPNDMYGTLQRAPKDNAHHREGWRTDQLRDLAEDRDTLESMARFMSLLCSSAVPDHWIVHTAMELDSTIAVALLDASNAYGMLDRRAIERRLVAYPRFHCLLPLFNTLYGGGSAASAYDQRSGDGAPAAEFRI
eukprot:jgi/Tetstr1/434611/TSEL_023702.t1